MIFVIEVHWNIAKNINFLQNFSIEYLHITPSHSPVRCLTLIQTLKVAQVTQ